MRKRRTMDEAFASTCRANAKMEEDAVAGTYRSIEQMTDNPVILNRVRTIILHSVMLGRYQNAAKSGVPA